MSYCHSKKNVLHLVFAMVVEFLLKVITVAKYVPCVIANGTTQTKR